MKLEESAQAQARRSILIVEDNEINREMLSALLEEDFDVYEAENGFIGLQQLEEHYEDLSLVLLDLLMPECDGFEFLRRRKADDRFGTVPVIVATASGSLKDEIKCLELGANDFVVKPYNFEIMLNRINNTVHLRESASMVNLLTWDNLTGLYSKEIFFHNVEDILRADPQRDLDLVCSDISNFKALNDRYGAHTCDKLLQELASRLSEKLPGVIAAGRIAGDTFAFLVEHLHPDWEDGLAGLLDDMPVANPGVKLGVVANVDHEVTAAITCDRAIMASDELPSATGIAVAYYDEKLREQQQMEQLIIETMEQALAEHQFTVWFQPKHNLRTDKTGGAEALVRWIHPELGFISPGVFIPVFERNGLIAQLDMYVWEEACKEIRRCMDLGLPAVPVSINASRIDFDMPDLADRIAALADKYGIERSLLHVELTESAYADNPDQMAESLRDLREHGFLIELDDFGSGFSSLASLNVLPLDVMKLDMSLIRQATKLGDFRIVESSIKLAHIMGLKTVVEGVEYAEEVEKLRELDADFIQGYYFSKPLKTDEFEAYIGK